MGVLREWVCCTLVGAYGSTPYASSIGMQNGNSPPWKVRSKLTSHLISTVVAAQVVQSNGTAYINNYNRSYSIVVATLAVLSVVSLTMQLYFLPGVHVLVVESVHVLVQWLPVDHAVNPAQGAM